MKKIAVIGAGVVGLSTALCLQEAFPSFEISIFADKFDNETLSWGAGGLFRPELYVHPDSQLTRKWCHASFSHFKNIFNSPEATAAGMQLVSGYHLSSAQPIKNVLLEELVPECREMKPKELSLFPSQYKNGLFFTTIITDCRYYLPWMKSKFERANGKVFKMHVSSFSEIPEEYDIIVNCSGLEAKNLLEDPFLVPIRGQTIKVKAPWIKHFYYGDDAYIVPGIDYVTLGGIKDFGSQDMKVNSFQKEFIWHKCVELVPSLEKAEVLWDWVGLRPHRSAVRIDATFVKCNERLRLVVNNYGHGSHGVTLSWGTALETANLIQNEILKKEFVLSRL